mgnify:FL=1
MLKLKNVLMILFMSLILFLIPNISNAAVETTRDIYSNNGSMKFTFTGLELDTTHEYEFGFTKTAAAQVEDWFLIADYTETTAVVDLITTTDEIREVINASDTGYITIKDKNTDTVVVEPYEVNTQIPFLQVTDFTVIENGKEFTSSENNCINVGIRNADNSEAYYQYEKITDQNIIDKYEEIKAENGDFKELESMLKTTAPTSNWSNWNYWNGHDSITGLNGYGYTESPISAPDEGLYYMWVYFSGQNIKNVYGYILVDNLSAEEPNDDDQNQNQNQNNIAGNQNNTQRPTNDNTTAGVRLPNAGNSLIAIGIALIVIFYAKNKKYEGIK